MKVSFASSNFLPPPSYYRSNLRVDGSTYSNSVSCFGKAKQLDETQLAIKKIKESKDINPKGRRAMRENFKNNPWFSPLEYVENFINLAYFKNEDGESTFYNFNQIDAILNVNPCSVESSYLQTIIDLAQNGEICPDALINMEKNFAINDDLVQDIELFYDVVDKNRDKTKLQQELIDAYIPEVDSVQEGLDNSKIGDAFLVKGEKYIRMKDDENSSKLMKISKKTYAELFPPIQRFAGFQNDNFGDCYLIETIMFLFQNPKFRTKLVSMFKESGSRNIKINFPNGLKEVTLYDKNVPFEEESSLAYCSSVRGYMLLEYAYGKNLEEKVIRELMSKLDSKSLVRFKNFLNKNPDDYFINKEKRTWEKFSSWQKRDNNNADDTFCQHLIANGGHCHDVLYTFGFDPVNYLPKIYEDGTKEFVLIQEPYLKSKKQIEREVLSSPAMSASQLTSFILENKLFDSFEFMVAIENHQCALKQVINKKGKPEYRLYNPHCQALPTKITDLESFLNGKVRLYLIEK